MPAAISCVAAGIESAGNKTFDTSMLIGLITTRCLPTSISSNGVMTRLAGGDESATMVEVTLGNLSSLRMGAGYDCMGVSSRLEPSKK